MSYRYSRSLFLILAIPTIALALSGCPQQKAEGEGEGEEGEGEGGEGEGEGEGVDPDCNDYEFRGENYNCGAVDRCNNTDFQTALACCECNPLYCDPDPTCGGEGEGEGEGEEELSESCMQCHNGAGHNNDYSGYGLSNPHPFGVPGGNIRCTECHGGYGNEQGKIEAHIPPPPQIGTRQNQQVNPEAWFNRLVLAGVDKYPDYSANGKTYTAKQYLQFINPGDLRVVTNGVGCGSCHSQHATSLARSSPIGTEIGFFSSATYHIGVDNAVPENQGKFQDTASDYSYRGTVDPNFNAADAEIGQIGRTIEVPEYAGYTGGENWRNNPTLTAANLADDQYNSNNFVTDQAEDNGKVRTGSDLAKLYQTQITITCGDCHAGSRGANNRYADFRGAGCTSCHMEYSPDGRSRSTDQNINKLEPANPDAIAAPEIPHISTHQIRNIAKILPNGAFLRGVSDRACVGCHQGSNRTVLQYWGIRLDQNADVANNFQYPANPAAFQNTAQDERLYDPAVQNNTFNGRNANQYILFEDYDNDGRDDTSPDRHYEMGMGCIDCHGLRDVHAGMEGDDDSGFGGKIYSKMDQVVKIRCESCHGTIDTYAPTVPCTDYSGNPKQCPTDSAGNAIRNVEKDANGDFFLYSRVDGQRHYLPQTKDVVYPNNRQNPLSGVLIFNAKASYAMGRADGLVDNGIGPTQTTPGLVGNNFSHTDNLDCISCHASWANQCIGCHLRTQYDATNYFFSNLTGERIVQKQQNADFGYITIVPTYLGVNSKNKITQISAGMKVFYAYTDLNGDTSQVFAFSDRNGNGNNPNYNGRNAHPALGNYQMAPHSIRGKVEEDFEGPKYCVTCHMTTAGLAAFGADYANFVTDYTNRNYANLDFALLQQHIGQNPGNQLNSPYFVHATAGLGSGLFLHDAAACPVNPLDANDNRFFCNGTSPQDQFANQVNNVAYDLDRFVEVTGVTNSSSLHPLIEFPENNLRDGSQNPLMSGTLGASMITKMTQTNNAAGGRVLDSWIDADGNAQGDAANYIQ
jgi:hypothetical protein